MQGAKTFSAELDIECTDRQRLRPFLDLEMHTMLRTLLQAKLHGVRVSEADLEYEGSCGIDATLLELSGLIENQYIEIYNVTNGERFATYVIREPAGSGKISLNGAAARKAMVGDKLIIAAYSQYAEAELESYAPVVVLIDEQNRGRLK